MKTYSEKLKDPRWQRKRLEILQRDDFRCSCCGDESNQLQIHHTFYLSGKNPWEYDDQTLKTFCAKCHSEITERTPEYMMLSDDPERMMMNTQLLRYFTTLNKVNSSLLFEMAYSLTITEGCNDYSVLEYVHKWIGEILHKKGRASE